MRLRLVPRPAAAPRALLGLLVSLLLATATVPVLAGPARAASVVVAGQVTGLNAAGVTVPIKDVFVEANDAQGRVLEPRVYAYTASDGTYQLTLPETGAYQIAMECWGDYECAQDYAPEPPINRSFSAATTINATLERWGRITGTVKKAGQAIAWPAGLITASNDARQYWSNSTPATVDSNGRFAIDKVAPGSVKVAGRESWDVENFLSTPDGQTFTVTAGATTDITLVAEDWPGLYVRAVDAASGAPLSDIGWQVYSRPVGGTWDDGLQMGPLLTDAAGRMSHRISDKTREYTVCFIAPDGTPRREKRCLGGSTGLAGATVWKHSAAQAKLKVDIALPYTFTTAATLTITGSARVGATLTAHAGTWVPAAEGTAYQWFRSGSAIPGATAATYQVGAADAGHRLAVRVSATRSGYAPGEARSSVTAPVSLAAFATAPAPKIVGKAKVRSKLKAVVGTWSPAPVTSTYQWFRNGKRIKGAVQGTYKVTKTDRRKRITVVVTQTRPGYATLARKSAATKKVR